MAESEDMFDGFVVRPLLEEHSILTIGHTQSHSPALYEDTVRDKFDSFAGIVEDAIGRLLTDAGSATAWSPNVKVLEATLTVGNRAAAKNFQNSSLPRAMGSTAQKVPVEQHVANKRASWTIDLSALTVRVAQSVRIKVEKRSAE